MNTSSIPWEKSRFLPHTRTATVEGVHIALYHNPGLRPELYNVFVPGRMAWTFRSPDLAEAGALRLITSVLAQRKEQQQMQLELVPPREPTQLPPGDISDAVIPPMESDFNDDEEGVELEDDDEDSMIRDEEGND